MPIIVVGAGIIGVTIAYALQQRGHQVILIERDAPGKGASYGNMASISVTGFMPASRPEVWKQIPGWMLNPDGPIRIRPGYMWHLAPWFARFIAAGMPTKWPTLAAQGAALCGRVYDDLLPLLQETGLTGELTEEGCLSIYENEAEFQSDLENIRLLEKFGFPHEKLDRQRIAQLEPELSEKIKIAVLLPQNRSVRDPYRLVTALAEQFVARGGIIQRGEVVGFQRAETIQALHLADGQTLTADHIIICAGAYSGQLAKLLGEPIPLETERGYHTQIMSPGITMRHSLIWPARAFMVTPTAGGIRVGGTVEMAGLEAPPNYRRAQVTLRHAQHALPGLRAKDTTEWMGHRPALPDTIPIISASARTKGVYYATGHGHLGLTYAATTARLMADLVTGVRPPIDMHPYRVNRF